MKTSLYTVITVFLFLCSVTTIAQERPFGLGIIIGEPSGLSAKLWVSSATAFDLGLGWSLGGDRIGDYDGEYNGGSRLHFHMDYLWHLFNAINGLESFPLYTGAGWRINSGAGYRNSVAVRAVFGIIWLPRQTPMDIFLEIVPSLEVMPSTGFGIDGGLGARFFF